MKRFFKMGLLAAMLCLLLCGCDFWMDGHYVSVTPYQERNYHAVKPVVQVSSSTQMRSTLVDFVENGVQKGVISVSDFNSPTVHFYMEQAIHQVKNNNPVGAYAVEDIRYEIGTNTGAAAVAVEITYRRDRSEILRIKKTEKMGDAVDAIYDALQDCNGAVAVYVEEYEPMDIEQVVRNYAQANPDVVMEIPKVTMSVYPETGTARIVEVLFTYKTSRETMRHMQEVVAPVFASSELYVQSEVQVREKYAQLYTFLMERFDYTIESSVTPAYSLLQLGTGDTQAFATVYAAMCRRAGLECHIISGTKDGEPRYWNLVYFRGGYHHIDLLICAQTGGFSYYDSAEMPEYDWDPSLYPLG